jgi:nucleotide-binding universal stress UspA family protein
MISFGPPGAAGKKLLARAEAKVRKRGIEVDTVLLETVGRRVADLIIKQAKKWRADLIVLGAHGRRGLSRVVMGSDAELVLRKTPLPVLLVRSRLHPHKRRPRRGSP